MSYRERDRLRRLIRRAEFLKERFLLSDKDRAYDKAEYSALRWAVQYIEFADKELGGFCIDR